MPYRKLEGSKLHSKVGEVADWNAQKPQVKGTHAKPKLLLVRDPI